MTTYSLPKLNLKQPLGKLLASTGACLYARKWAKAAGFKTAAEAWNKCPHPHWMLWALQRAGMDNSPDTKRKLRRFAGWCAKQAHIPHYRSYSAFSSATGTAAAAAITIADRNHDICSDGSWKRCHAFACALQAHELRRILGNPFESRQ